MPSRVLGLVYANDHNVLTVASNGYCRLLGLAGFPAETIDLTIPGNSRLLAEKLDSGEVAFCFGMQGVGSRLTRGDVNLWTQTQTPFIGLHYDNPCYQPLNHGIDSPFIANLYHFESFLEIQRRYIGGPSMSTLLPFDIIHVRTEPNISFHERPIRLLFLKAGGTVDEELAYFDNLPSPVRDGVRDLLQLARQNPNLLLCDLVSQLMAGLKIDRHAHEKDFWGLVRAMDSYIRRQRAIDFVNWLKFQDGAVIVGNGWDFIDRTGARAEFRAAVSIEDAFPLYDQAQFVCNVTPYGRDLIHERVVLGLLAESCVLTDTNAWWDEHFATVPALTRFSWNRPLDEQLQPAIRDLAQAASRASTGRAPTLRYFSGHDNINRIVQVAEQIRRSAADSARAG